MDTIALHISPSRGSTSRWDQMGDRSPQPSRLRPRDVNGAVRRRVSDGDLRGGTEVAFAVYGPEVFGFLIGVIDDVDAAKDVYGEVVQRVRTEIDGFGWRSTLRVWLYALCRRELRDWRLRKRRAAIVPEAESAPAEVSHARRLPGRARALSKLRRTMTQEERELLILRIDRRLDWTELAQTALGEAASIGELKEELKRTKARVGAILARLESVAVKEQLLRPPRP